MSLLSFSIEDSKSLRCYIKRDYHSQVVEFELSASTLRTNSSAMTLSKTLVTQSMVDVFIVLEDFRPRPRPEIPQHAKEWMEKWARTEERWWKREGTWEAVKHQLEWEAWDSEALQEREVEWVRERTRESLWKRAESRRVALGNEKNEPLSSTRRDGRWKVSDRRWNTDNIFERRRSREDKKRTTMKARQQLRNLGVIEVGGQSAPGKRLSGHQLERVRMDWWGDGWLKRVEDEFEWMEKDQAEHPDEWREDWPRMHLWWDDVREWAERWRWRNDVIEEFEKTSGNLLTELEKIDGNASAREFNVFSTSETAYSVERCRHLTDHIANMKIALVAGDEPQFVLSCKSALDLIGGVLRSKGVKKGVN